MHKQYTGVSNRKILANARFLIEQEADVLFRMPLIPGINDSPKNIEDTANFLKSLGPKGMRIELLPFHRLGQTKYDALNIKYEFENVQVMETSEVEAVKEQFLSYGVDCTISR